MFVHWVAFFLLPLLIFPYCLAKDFFLKCGKWGVDFNSRPIRIIFCASSRSSGGSSITSLLSPLCGYATKGLLGRTWTEQGISRVRSVPHLIESFQSFASFKLIDLNIAHNLL